MKRNFFQTATMVIVFTFISRVSGFIREIVLGYLFGITSFMDAFLVAFMLPSIIGSVLESSIVSVFVPKYMQLKEDDDRENADFLIGVFLFFICTISFLSISFILFFSETIILFLAPGFSASQRIMVDVMLKIMLPCIFFYGLFGIYSAILQAERKFTLPSLASLPFNLASICCTWFLMKKIGIYGLAWGTLVGVFLQFLFVYMGNRKQGVCYSLVKMNFMGISRDILSAIITNALTGASIFIDRILGSYFVAGSIAALNYANRVSILFIAVLVNPILTVLFPELSRACASDQQEKLKNMLRDSMRISLYLIVPLVVVLCVFNQEIISFLFERGAFDKNAVHVTARLFLIYSVGILGYFLLELMRRVFYAQREFLFSMYVGIVVISLQGVLAIFLRQHFDVYGLALAYVLSIFGGAACYFLRFLHVHYDDHWQLFKAVMLFCAQLLVSASIMYCFSFLPFFAITSDGWLLMGLLLAMKSLVLCIIYSWVMFILGSKESVSIFRYIKTKYIK